MSTKVLQKRTFLATLPPFLATPPVAGEIGQIVVSSNAAQRGVYIGLADAMPAGVPTNPLWHQIDGGAASINVSVNIPTGTGASVEDDINEFDFAASPATLPKDSTALSEALLLAGYNVYFICARDGATYLYGGAVPVAVGNEAAPFDGSVPGAPAPTDESHTTVFTADLIPFGGNPDAMIQHPAAASPQSITPGAIDDIALTLTPMAGQTASLLDMGGITFTPDGFLRGTQGAVSSTQLIKLEQFGGAAPVVSGHLRGDPTTDLVLISMAADPLGDGVGRATLSGAPAAELLIEYAIMDGGTFT